MPIMIEVTGIDEAIKNLRSISHQWTTPNSRMYGDIGKISRNSVTQNFNAQGRPDHWEPRKDTKPHPILDKTGRMRDAAETTSQIWTQEGFAHHINIRTPAYGLIHQYGRGRVPMRKFVEFLQSEIQAIRDRIRKTVEGKDNA